MKKLFNLIYFNLYGVFLASFSLFSCPVDIMEKGFKNNMYVGCLLSCFELVLGGLNGFYSTREVGFCISGLNKFNSAKYLLCRRIRFNLSSNQRCLNHSWEKVDRVDSYLETIRAVDLREEDVMDIPFGQVKLYKAKSIIYGLDKYVFSKDMRLEIAAVDIDSRKEVILAAASIFLQGLKDHTVYKCLFIGITGDGDVKTSSEGGFHISRYTRPEFIFMKIKSGVTQFEFRYKGIGFDNYTIAYKRWLTLPEIDNIRKEMELALDKMCRIDMAANKSRMVGMRAELETPGLNKLFYNR